MRAISFSGVMREIYWFRDDLRLQDNPGLLEHAQATALLCVFFWPRPRPWCNVSGIGVQRERFLLESLQALRDVLRARGQDLLVLHGAPELLLPELAAQHRIARIGVASSVGVDEQSQLERVRGRVGIPLELHPANTLFRQEQLAFVPGEMPRQFTPFRERVEALDVDAVQPVPDALPPPPRGARFAALPRALASPHPGFTARGGTAAGEQRLYDWMWRERAAAHYKDTRNALDGLYASGRLSPWLANGSLSVRQVALELFRFEREETRNDSTRWFWQELLWREFFHWRARVDGVRLFAPGGIGGRRALCCFDPRAFARWCAGDTDHPLVNALMRQLVQTGWMSNRGRQIAASCLVNELGLDWRYGAAFFEKHLIDYDVASNYGNWQYIAGVGCDPRGGRHFNLAKQAAIFDPDGEFTRAWGGLRPVQPRYVVDAADWPI